MQKIIKIAGKRQVGVEKQKVVLVENVSEGGKGNHHHLAAFRLSPQ